MHAILDDDNDNGGGENESKKIDFATALNANCDSSKHKFIEDIYFFEVNNKCISSSVVKKTVFFTSA